MRMTSSSQLDLLSDSSRSVDAEVHAQVWGLLTTLYPKSGQTEKRRDNRYPFPHLIQLTPVGKDGVALKDDAVVVVGKHLSERGLGFYHPKPLPYRRVIASIETSVGHWFAFLIDVNWCRFTRHGWYESGGRFLEAVLPPTAACAPQQPD